MITCKVIDKPIRWDYKVYEAGETLDLPPTKARQFVKYGLVEIVEGTAAKEAAVPETASAEPEAEVADKPQPKKKKVKKK